MMQGDQFFLPIQILTQNDILDASYFEDVEVTVGYISKTMKNGGVTFDESRGAFLADLRQRDTFSMVGVTPVSIRVKFTSGEVVGLKVGEITFEESISKAVL